MLTQTVSLHADVLNSSCTNQLSVLCKRAEYPADAQPGVAAGLSVLKVCTCCSRQ